MRLTELDPKWLLRDGVHVGFVFRCPTTPNDPNNRQSCVFMKMSVREQIDLWENNGFEDRHMIQPCNQNASWEWNGKDFDAITVTPSIDGSRAGNWHGFITDGAIVGGL